MKFALYVMLILTLVSFASIGHAAEPSIVGYQAWKSARVDEARLGLERAHMGSETSKSDKKSVKSAKGDAKVQQAQLNLDIAQELTVNDYFLLYLRQFKNKDAFVEASKKLTPEETADLLMAYQKHLVGPQQVDVIVPASAQLEVPAVTK